MQRFPQRSWQVGQWCDIGPNLYGNTWWVLPVKSFTAYIWLQEDKAYLVSWLRHNLDFWLGDLPVLCSTCESISMNLLLVARNDDWLVVEPYPSETWWSSSVGMMTFHSLFWMENHNPAMFQTINQEWRRQLSGSRSWTESTILERSLPTSWEGRFVEW